MPDAEERYLSTGSPILNNTKSANNDERGEEVDVTNLVDVWSVNRIHFQHAVD
jgi:hypothetical protein